MYYSQISMCTENRPSRFAVSQANAVTGVGRSQNKDKLKTYVLLCPVLTHIAPKHHPKKFVKQHQQNALRNAQHGIRGNILLHFGSAPILFNDWLQHMVGFSPLQLEVKFFGYFKKLATQRVKVLVNCHTEKNEVTHHSDAIFKFSRRPITKLNAYTTNNTMAAASPIHVFGSLSFILW